MRPLPAGKRSRLVSRLSSVLFKPSRADIVITSEVPLGDSITEITCWRALIWDMLAEEGLADQVDFVGSRPTNPQKCEAKSGHFDVDHEGHSGWQAVNIANAWIDTWMKAQKPDITMFMLGSNDVTAGRATAQIVAAYDTILGSMRAVNPRMKVIASVLLFGFFLSFFFGLLLFQPTFFSPLYSIKLLTA